MVFQINMEKVYRVAADLETASGRVGKVGRAKLGEQADKTLEVQKQMAPVRTGKLRDDLSVEMQGDGRSSSLVAIVGASADPPRESFFQENGTSRMPAHPFIAPSELMAEYEWPIKADEILGEVTDGI